MSGKADRLRGRLSINPDEVPAPLHAARPLRVQPNPTSQAPPAGALEDGNSAAALRPVEVTETPAAAERTSLTSKTPTDGPAYFRSFYVGNEVYDRFRAAIFWTSRNPRATGAVPENMSAAVEQFMASMAADLERRYNDGKVFPNPPKTRRRRRQFSED